MKGQYYSLMDYRNSSVKPSHYLYHNMCLKYIKGHNFYSFDLFLSLKSKIKTAPMLRNRPLKFPWHVIYSKCKLLLCFNFYSEKLQIYSPLFMQKNTLPRFQTNDVWVSLTCLNSIMTSGLFTPYKVWDAPLTDWFDFFFFSSSVDYLHLPITSSAILNT